jgi:hypothetical protein
MTDPKVESLRDSEVCPICSTTMTEFCSHACGTLYCDKCHEIYHFDEEDGILTQGSSIFCENEEE